MLFQRSYQPFTSPFTSVERLQKMVQMTPRRDRAKRSQTCHLNWEAKLTT